MRRGLLTGALVAVVLSGSAASAQPRAVGTPAAAPFAHAAPRTAAARTAADVVVIGMPVDIGGGFNTALACCNSGAAEAQGAREALHGAFIQNERGEWVEDLVTHASASRAGLTYTISPKAFWYWGGRKLPVTYRDFVYTLQQIDHPANKVAGRTGYANLDPNRWKHTGERQVTFFWRTGGCSTDFPCGPYANWQSLFGTLYPAAALAGLDFNTIWTNCICGSDGRPVANGPFYLAKYAKGTGSTLVRNPYWGGTKPRIARIVFQLIPDQNLMVEAMRNGAVDAIVPAFGAYLLPLKDVPGITFDQVPGYVLEHLEFREGRGASNALLRAPWMRQAIGLALARQSMVDAVLGPRSGVEPLDNLVYFPTQADYRPDFARWNHNPAQALALLKKHCTGGPSAPSSSNKKVWQCAGLPAVFTWTWAAESAFRTQIEAVADADLQSVGISIIERPLPANTIFGPSGIPSGNFDIADFSWLTSGDPADSNEILRCSGPSNYTGYCSHEVDALLHAATRELDPTQRAALFRRADAILAADVPSMPLYARPMVMIHKSDLLGMRLNPDSEGPFWNVEDWRWKR